MTHRQLVIRHLGIGFAVALTIACVVWWQFIHRTSAGWLVLAWLIGINPVAFFYYGFDKSALSGKIYRSGGQFQQAFRELFQFPLLAGSLQSGLIFCKQSATRHHRAQWSVGEPAGSALAESRIDQPMVSGGGWMRI